MFIGARDRNRFTWLVEEGRQRFCYQVLAYALIEDQANLVIRVGKVSLSRIVQHIAFMYTRYFNERHNRTGSLFVGRYRGVLIEPGDYLAATVRYVHLLPKRRGATRDPEHYPGSSYSVYLGKREAPWLNQQPILEHFGQSSESVVKVLRRFHDQPQNDENMRQFVRGNVDARVLGSVAFCKKILKIRANKSPGIKLSAVARYVCGQEGVRESWLKTPSRKRRLSQIRQIIAYLGVELGVATLSDAARRYDRDLTTMSRNQRYFRDTMVADAGLRNRVQKYRRELLQH